jgi:predicted SAM-dependent methyltransferase
MKKPRSKPIVPPAPKPPLKLDLGCGMRKIGPEWVGVDRVKMVGVDLVLDLTARHRAKGYPEEPLQVGPVPFEPWPWEDGSVDEARANHFIEHLDAAERCHFFNELWRVLKPGAGIWVGGPDWSNQRAYGDLTHKWPPISSFFWLYLSRDWRIREAPALEHSVSGEWFTCNFDTISQVVTYDPRFNGMVSERIGVEVRDHKDAVYDNQVILKKIAYDEKAKYGAEQVPTIPGGGKA